MRCAALYSERAGPRREPGGGGRRPVEPSGARGAPALGSRRAGAGAARRLAGAAAILSFPGRLWAGPGLAAAPLPARPGPAPARRLPGLGRRCRPPAAFCPGNRLRHPECGRWGGRALGSSSPPLRVILRPGGNRGRGLVTDFMEGDFPAVPSSSAEK